MVERRVVVSSLVASACHMAECPPGVGSASPDFDKLIRAARGKGSPGRGWDSPSEWDAIDLANYRDQYRR